MSECGSIYYVLFGSAACTQRESVVERVLASSNPDAPLRQALLSSFHSLSDLGEWLANFWLAQPMGWADMGNVEESGGVECVINEMKWPGAFRPGAGGHSLDVVRAVD